MTLIANGTVPAKRIDTANDLDVYEGTDGSLFVTLAGTKVPIGSAWGPAADSSGNWFTWRAGADPQRVASRDAAIAFITAPIAEEAKA
jgi:hypothetical protein